MGRRFLAFDIETCGLPFEEFSESQREYILRNATTEEEKAKRLKELALSPLTSQVVCIGLLLMEKVEDNTFQRVNEAAWACDNKLADEQVEERVLSNNVPCYVCNERKLLKDFWVILKKYPDIHLVSFNGRNFDAPFLMLRSALLGVRPTRDLMSGTKFSYFGHTDLLDELTFYNPSSYGATKRFNFDFYTRAFGITSPKSAGVDGSKVNELFLQGDIIAISEYCLRDVNATWELFLLWNEYLNFDKF